MAAAGHAVVPKFGSWDAENIGYTVFFDKVRDNKPAPPNKPPAAGASDDFDPYEHYENLSRKVPSRPPSSHGGHGHAPAPATKAPAPGGGGGYDLDPYEHYESLSSRNVPSRPPSSHGHAPAGYDYYDRYEHYDNLSSRNAPGRPPNSHGHAPPPPQHQHQHQHPGGHGYHHRRTGSNGSNAASEASSRGSKFSPPRPYQPRYSSNNYPAQPQSGGHGAAQYHHRQQQHGAAHAQYHHHQQQQHGAPRAASPTPSPPRHYQPPPPRRPKPSAVPRFGVWDEQNAAMAAQGFTVQFEKVKRHREEARTAPAPRPQETLPPDHAAGAAGARRHAKRKPKRSFMSRMYRCLFPRVREWE